MNLFVLFVIFHAILARAQGTHYFLDNKEIIVPKIGTQLTLTSHPRFSGFIQKVFNRAANFHGPNCYNTALVMSGFMNEDEIRYVSPEEFQSILKSNFKAVDVPSYKDIIVFDAQNSRGHAAFYLGDNLIFHKKSPNIKYLYRITTIDLAGEVEENEWVPSPMEGASEQMSWPELGGLAKAYYRIQSKVAPDLDKRISSLVLKLKSLLLFDLKKWDTGKKWGMTGEYFLQDLVKYTKKIKSDSYTLGVVTSLNDQLFTMLEEVYFKRGNRSTDSIFKEICVPEDKTQLFSLIKDLGILLGRDREAIENVLKQIETQDKLGCSLRPFVLLGEN